MQKNSFDNLKLPKIILKDRYGTILNTETSYQNQIAYERLKLRQNVSEKEDNLIKNFDWRLPYAPVPSKPDYSRVRAPYTKIRHFNQTKWTKEYAEILRHKRFLRYLNLSSLKVSLKLIFFECLRLYHFFASNWN